MVYLTQNGKLISSGGVLMVSSVNSFPAGEESPPPAGLEQSGITQTGLQGYFVAGSSVSIQEQELHGMM